MIGFKVIATKAAAQYFQLGEAAAIKIGEIAVISALIPSSRLTFTFDIR